MINFEINNLTKNKIDKKFLLTVAEKVIKIIKLKDLKEISIVFVGDGRIKELNKKYRKKNQVTDVLAFDYGPPFGGQGEIFICLPQAKKQAKRLGNIFKKELSILLIHGLLHLAGYNDGNEEDFNKMQKKQQEIWQEIIS